MSTTEERYKRWLENQKPNPDDYTGVTMLSIVMITIPERKNEFMVLRREIMKQIDFCRQTHPSLGLVKVVVINTKKFNDDGPSIGVKRQQGLDVATGKYIIWLDDDDGIAPNYVETILRLASKGADVCTFNNVSKFENYWCIIQMSLKTKIDEQTRPGIINRRPYHVCAWRREMLSGIKFPDANIDEDTAFIKEALKVAKTEAHSDAIIHEYNRNQISYAQEVCR